MINTEELNKLIEKQQEQLRDCSCSFNTCEKCVLAYVTIKRLEEFINGRTNPGQT